MAEQIVVFLQAAAQLIRIKFQQCGEFRGALADLFAVCLAKPHEKLLDGKKLLQLRIRIFVQIGGDMDKTAFAFHDWRLQNNRTGFRQLGAERFRFTIAKFMEDCIQDGFDFVVEIRRGLHVDGMQGVHGGFIAHDGFHGDDEQS